MPSAAATLPELASLPTRERLVQAAAHLLATEGREAVSTRAVSALAGVQPPTIYRLLGGMDRLLDAVASFGLERYLTQKKALIETPDPVADLRQMWDLHIEFGLTNPPFYLLAFCDPLSDRSSVRGAEALTLLRNTVARVAVAGRVGVSADRAAALVHASGVGTVCTLLAVPPAQRDTDLSTAARENVLSAILTDAGPGTPPAFGVVSQAVGLREALREQSLTMFSPGERGLLAEWLDRLASVPASSRQTPAAPTAAPRRPSHPGTGAVRREADRMETMPTNRG